MIGLVSEVSLPSRVISTNPWQRTLDAARVNLQAALESLAG